MAPKEYLRKAISEAVLNFRSESEGREKLLKRSASEKEALELVSAFG